MSLGSLETVIDLESLANLASRDGVEGEAPGVTSVHMRAARAIDEVRVMEDFRVYLFPDVLAELLLARVTTRADGAPVSVREIQSLSASDRSRLDAAYAELNDYAIPAGDAL
ncbi:MAG: hypothetical protein AAF517_06555 [Planctomycetota bacterium]